MSEERLVAKLRFEEFNSDWTYYPLLDTVVKVIDFRGRTPRKLGLDWSSEGVLALSALNVKNGYIDKDIDAHYGNKELYNKWMLGNELHKNQVLFTTEAPMGNVAQIPDNNKYILSQRTIAFEVNEDLIIEDYLAVVLRTPNIFQELINLSSGGTAKGVSQRTLSELDIPIPQKIIEQEKIGSFFRKIDEMIQLQQSKVNKVKDIKSAYLSEMFPKEGEKYPKKRFEGFTEPWQSFKIGDLGQFRSNGVNKKTKVNDNPAYLLNYMDVYNKLNINQKNYKNLMKVTATNRELQDNDIMKNDVFFTPTSETADDIGRVLTIEHDLPETVYSYHLIRFRPIEKRLYATFPNYGFATQYLRKQMETAAQGVQRFVIGLTAFQDLKVYLPSYEEQKEIAKFFENLDNQISIEEEKLAKLKKLKQAYLNDMFV